MKNSSAILFYAASLAAAVGIFLLIRFAGLRISPPSIRNRKKFRLHRHPLKPLPFYCTCCSR
jgi:hypothetical protein